MDKQPNTHWKLSEVCQHTVDYVQTKFENKIHTFCNSTGETKSSVLQNHRQKFTSPFSTVQVMHLEITHAIHQLLTFDECGLVNPVAFVVAMWGRAVNRQPLPIPHMHQHLPPLVRAVCATRADVYACVVYLHARQG